MNLNTTSNDFVDNIHLVDDTLRKKFRNLEKQLKKQINIKWSIAYIDIYIYITRVCLCVCVCVNSTLHTFFLKIS